MSDVKWKNDKLQFARLIAEIEAAGGFTESLIQALCTSMDLEKDQVTELIDRGQEFWDEQKEMPTIAELEANGEFVDGCPIGGYGDGPHGAMSEYLYKGKTYIVNVWEDERGTEIFVKDEDEGDAAQQEG